MSFTLTDSMRFRTGPIIAGIQETRSRGCPRWSCPGAAWSRCRRAWCIWSTRSVGWKTRFAPATSNGLAGGPSLSAAILSGLSELIERDALLITWMNRLPAVEIEFIDAGGPAAAVWRHYSRFGVEVRAFLLTTDLPASVVMAVAFDDDPGRPATLIGLGCHLDPAVAVEKAVFELCQARPSESKRYRDNPPRPRLKRYEDVQTLEDHPAFLALPERRGEFEFLWRRLKGYGCRIFRTSQAVTRNVIWRVV